MPKYRKKPVVVEAVQWTRGNFREVEALNGGMRGMNVDENGNMHIHTLEGWMQANPGDYIIRGVKGEIYPCKPDIFTMTYEEVKE